jgi:Cu2+-exporting ATPase
MFRDKFWLTLLLTIPIVVLSHDVQMWLGFEIPTFRGSAYFPAILGTAVFLYGGLVFIRAARGELADRQPGMMTLISLAILVAFITSWAGTLGLFEVEIWWELSSLIAIMLLGHWLEMRSIAPGARSARRPRGAAPRRGRADHAERDRNRSALGARSRRRPSGSSRSRVPADGEVAEGAADVDESMITGESRPVAKEKGDRVVAGTVAAVDRSGCG